MDNLTPTIIRRRPKLLRILKIARSTVLPIIASAFVAYGSVQYSKGRNENRLDSVEKNMEKGLTREEFTLWANEQRERLREINERLMQQEKRDQR